MRAIHAGLGGVEKPVYHAARMTVPIFDPRTRRAAWLIALLALTARAVFVLVVVEDRFFVDDEVDYLRLAERIAAGEWLGTTTHHMPGLVYFAAAGKLLGLGTEGLRLVHAALGAAAAGITVVLASLLFGTATGILAGVAVALYPYLLYVAGVFYAQNQVIPLLLLLLFALYKRQEGGDWGWVALAGISLGVAAHFMVPVLVTAPLLAIWHGLRVRPFREGVGDVALLTLITVLTLVPVTMRNYALDGRFVFVTSLGPGAFYGANHPEVDPEDRDPEKWRELNVTRVEEERMQRGWSRAQVDSALGARAREHVRQDPGRFLGNVLVRAQNMWVFTPHLWAENRHITPGKYLVAAATSAPVLVLAAAGAVFFLGRFWLLFPFYTVPVFLTAALSLFNTTVLSRLTFEPLLIILAAAFLVRIVARRHLGGVVAGAWPGRLKESG